MATAVKLGLRDYIVKPWAIDELLKIVENAIAAKPQDEGAHQLSA